VVSENSRYINGTLFLTSFKKSGAASLIAEISTQPFFQVSIVISVFNFSIHQKGGF